MNSRILLTATGSGCGKTTITIALLKALSNRGLKTVSFKCGPDYIDPMYHRKTLEIPAYNLDPFFCDGPNLKDILQKGLKGNDIGIIEGVMGYYDGYGLEGQASTWEVADKTDTPAILIVNAKGMSNSIGAVLKGFTSYRENHHIKGVIFNNISSGMYPMLASIAKSEGIIPLGFMPHNKAIELESRHLGLVTASELKNIADTISLLGKMAEENLDIDAIIRLGKECGELETAHSLDNELKKITEGLPGGTLKLAVARDDAFCFIYQENLDILKALGCKIVYFSPLKDDKLPDDCYGIYLPGGYPELYLESLSQNTGMLAAIREAIEKGMPVIAECGGFMYLHEKVEEKTLVGVVKGSASKQSRLVRFGYGTMKAKETGMLFKKGESIRVHEFHYYDSENVGDSFEITKASNGTKYGCAYSTNNMYAGYPHLYFRANANAALNFVNAMREFKG